jgi:hypothetical protein
MWTDAMTPEEFEQAHEYAGPFTAAGFLTAFARSRPGGPEAGLRWGYRLG